MLTELPLEDFNLDNMKLLKRFMEKKCGGSLSLIPEDSEDMWHLYNLISVGDSVRASTIRKVVMESQTGSTTSSRVRTVLTINVEKIDFDTHAGMLRLQGKNISENTIVKMGAYHTVEVETQRKFTLSKKDWDIVALERILQACEPGHNADLAAVIMQEGLAHVCLVTSAMTVVKTKIDVHIPRKRPGSVTQYEKALNKFYETIITAMMRHFNFDVVKCVLIASPGFVKDQFFEFLNQWAVKTDNKTIFENKSKFLLVHSSSGFKHSLKEVLKDPSIQTRLADTKATNEVRALETFYKTLQHESAKAYYGEKHVFRAKEAQAIETLLISDKLFRAKKIADRKKFVKLVEDVRENGGDVKIFSSLHVSGEQLDQLTGVCAILRFPMEEIEEEDVSSAESSSESDNEGESD